MGGDPTRVNLDRMPAGLGRWYGVPTQTAYGRTVPIGSGVWYRQQSARPRALRPRPCSLIAPQPVTEATPGAEAVWAVERTFAELSQQEATLTDPFAKATSPAAITALT
jgi:hypothetical protein